MIILLRPINDIRLLREPERYSLIHCTEDFIYFLDEITNQWIKVAENPLKQALFLYKPKSWHYLPETDELQLNLKLYGKTNKH